MVGGRQFALMLLVFVLFDAWSAEASSKHRLAAKTASKMDFDDDDTADDVADDDARDADEADDDDYDDNDGEEHKPAIGSKAKPTTGPKHTHVAVALAQAAHSQLPAPVPTVAPPPPVTPSPLVHTVDPCSQIVDKHKKHICKLKQDLAANQAMQVKLTQSLQRFSDEAKSAQEIDYKTAKVANETESKALASTLASMWKEMRTFDVPFYEERIEEELGLLKRKEKSLKKEIAGDENTDSQAVKEDSSSIDANAVQGSSYTNFWEMTRAKKEEFFVGSLVYILASLCVAVLFFKARDNSPIKDVFIQKARSDILRSPKEFSFSLFGCLGAPNLCIMGFCCPVITWANTLERHGFVQGLPGFAKVFMGMVLLVVLNSYTYGISIVCAVALGVYYRQKLRQFYAIENNSPRTFCLDALIWTCCQPCAVVQEAREEFVFPVEDP